MDSLQSACTTKTENNNRCTGVCSSSCLCYTTWVCGVIHILISGPRLEKKSNYIMNTSEAPFLHNIVFKNPFKCIDVCRRRIHNAVFILLFSSDTHEYTQTLSLLDRL